MESFYHDYYTRLADRLNSGEILKDLPNWICRHTKLRGKNFSFKDHEFQLEIARDQSQEIDVQKCSQVGMTELVIRLLLALLVVSQQKTGIYVMPHLNLAKMFTKSRVDPIIDTSPTLKDQRVSGVDSATLKQFGNSFLHIGGAESPRSAISTPAQVLVIDEFDFCNMRVLGMYSSRLRHAMDEMIKRRFSTPTVSNYGISRNVAISNQKRYMCRCEHCGMQQAPDFFLQVVIPGFDRSFEDFEIEDLANENYKVDQAYIACIKCKKPLDRSLANAEMREWVATYPTRSRVGYMVRPFDLIKTNNTPSIINQMSEYKTEQDYINFCHGLPRDTDENKINDKMVQATSVGDWIEEGRGWCLGIDIGKTCHVAVGRKVGHKRVVAHFAKCRIKDGSLIRQLADVCNRFDFDVIVVDHGPDVEIPAGLQEMFGMDVCHPCVYIKGRKEKPLWHEVKEDTGYVNVARTKCIDSFVQAVNGGRYVFPRNTEVMEEVRKHLQQMVRIEEEDEEGDLVASWVKSTDQDHFFHSLIYLHVAIELSDNELSGAKSVVPTTISSVLIGGKHIPPKMRDIQGGQIIQGDANMAVAAMFGRVR